MEGGSYGLNKIWLHHSCSCFSPSLILKVNGSILMVEGLGVEVCNYHCGVWEVGPAGNCVSHWRVVLTPLRKWVLWGLMRKLSSACLLWLSFLTQHLILLPHLFSLLHQTPDLRVPQFWVEDFSNSKPKVSLFSWVSPHRYLSGRKKKLVAIKTWRMVGRCQRWD